MKSKRYTPPKSSTVVTPDFGDRVNVLLTFPEGHPLHDRGGRIVTARWGISQGETRLWDFETDGRPVVDLPDDVLIQLPANVPVRGRLLVDDGVRIRRIGRRSPPR